MIIVFEDALVDQLAPVTLGRPAYAISCGSYCLADWLSDFEAPVRGFTRDYLRNVQQHDFPQLSMLLKAPPESLLLVNARIVPSAVNRTRLVQWWENRQANSTAGNRELIQNGSVTVEGKVADDGPAIVDSPITTNGPITADGQVTVDGQVCAALVTGDKTAELVRALSTQPVAAIQSTLTQLLSDVPRANIELDLFEWPHDVIRHHLETMADNMNDRLSRDTYHEVAEGVFTRGTVSVAPHVAWDTHAGPILLESDVQVGPGAFLEGPVHAQMGTKINEHAVLKEAVALGHTTKVGGEVEASIIERYSNKQHYGYLGHSYVGSWVNLGAGTCNSDLKNTYGQISVDYGGGKTNTQMQFLGCLIGDYTRTAIQTSIFTGKTVGVCSTLYGTVTANVPSFVNYARQLGQETEVSLDAMAATQRRMFERRGCRVHPWHIQLLRDMFQQTQSQRGLLPQEPLSL